jgi:hypothetical protein
MRRLALFIALFLLSWNPANAQTLNPSFGIRLEGVPTGIYSGGAYPTFGIQIGLETRWDAFALGARVSLSNFVLLAWHAEADLYGAYRLMDGTTLYGGLGWGGSAVLFVGAPAQDWHALLGVRLLGGFFFEVTPGIAFGDICIPDDRPQPTSSGGAVRPQAVPCSGYRPVQVFVIGLALGWVWTLP